MSKAPKSAICRLWLEIMICRLAFKDSRVPRSGKWLLGFALAYAFSPSALVSDFIPLLGQLDDFIIVPALLILALKLIPKGVLQDCHVRALITDRTIPAEAFYL